MTPQQKHTEGDQAQSTVRAVAGQAYDNHCQLANSSTCDYILEKALLSKGFKASLTLQQRFVKLHAGHNDDILPHVLP